MLTKPFKKSKVFRYHTHTIEWHVCKSENDCWQSDCCFDVIRFLAGENENWSSV